MVELSARLSFEPEQPISPSSPISSTIKLNILLLEVKNKREPFGKNRMTLWSSFKSLDIPNEFQGGLWHIYLLVTDCHVTSQLRHKCARTIGPPAVRSLAGRYISLLLLPYLRLRVYKIKIKYLQVLTILAESYFKNSIN